MNENTVVIDGKTIGKGYRPYIVAELSANHNGDLNKALKLVELAKECGADAIKIQTYTADTLTIKSDKKDFQIDSGLWQGKSLHELYEWAHTPWDWHKALFEKAKDVGITMFSSPFDNSAVDLLETFNVPAYKIASFELIDIPLVRYVASTGKPLIMSTGMANQEEIEEAVTAAKEAGAKDLILLQCVSAYPASPKDYHLATIPDMADHFNVVTGLSDHTIDNTTAIASVALGASLIEKHFTLDRHAGGPDDSFSLEPSDLKNLCVGAATAWEAIGKASYERRKNEEKNIKFRRSLYVTAGVKKGETFSCENLRSIRPGYGLAPKYYDEVIGKTATCDIDEGTALEWSLVDKEYEQSSG